MAVKDGSIVPDTDNDVLPLICVERYGKNGNIGRGLIHGFSLKRGAIAGSVAHDHHNIMVVGTDPEEMLAAVEALVDSQGGFVAVAGREVKAILPLPLCGLMSEEPLEKVDAGLSAVREAARKLEGEVVGEENDPVQGPAELPHEEDLVPGDEVGAGEPVRGPLGLVPYDGGGDVDATWPARRARMHQSVSSL